MCIRDRLYPDASIIKWTVKIVVGILLSCLLLLFLYHLQKQVYQKPDFFGKDLAQKIKKVTLLLVESYFLILNENQK
nr:hypothetical protein [Streptococcus suis]